jgi:DNA-binding response OmpR family regulator
LTPDQEPGPDPTVKILIVEDHNDMRAYLKAILQEHYQVFEASNGTMGLSEARRIKPDLVLTDIMMEETDGLDLCNLLRADQETSHIPVIMLTALHTMADRVRGLDTGADDYITKPFNELELLARIRTLLNRRSILMAMFSNEFRIEAPAPAIQSADARFIQRLIDIVDQHMDNPDFDVNILSESAGLSRSQLHRRLTEITGKSATGFIRVIRMKRAAQFLELGAGNISEAMYSVGFDNLSYFSKCFREVYGMSPGEYQDLKKRELKSQNETKSGKKLDNSTEMLVPKTT